MNKLELASQVSELWTRLGEMRSPEAGNRPLESDIAPFAAALFLLRLADRLETGQGAVDASDGRDCRQALPQAQQWSSWCDLRGDRLVEVLKEEVLPALHYALPGRSGKLFQQPALETVIKNLLGESPAVVETLVRWVQAFDPGTLPGRQAAGDALAALVEKAAEKARSTGDFTTPQPVVETMVDLLDPNPEERIYDPCFGTGGLLATAARRLHAKAMQMPRKDRTQLQQRSLFGMEIDPYPYCVGLARVLLEGVEKPALELGNALEGPLAQERFSGEFDCILAVPPWGGHLRPGIAARFQVPQANLETLFLQHVMDSLRQGGRAVVALPDAALFRTGPDQEVRKTLLTGFRVDGVASLPAGAFHPFTGIKTSLVLFRREEAAPAVRFMLVEEWPRLRPDEGSGREQAIAFARDVAEEFRRDEPNSNLWEIPVAELAERNWELLAKRTGEEVLSPLLGALQEAGPEVTVQPLDEVAEVFAGVEYEKSMITEQGDPSECAGLVRAADVNRPGALSLSLFLTGEGSARIESKHRLRAGDLLLTLSGAIGKLKVVSEPGGTVGAVADKSLAVIRPGERIASQFLKNLLASEVYQEWLRGHARGATVQHLSARTLGHLPVPVPPVPVQERVLKRVDEEGDDPFVALLHILMDDREPVISWLMGSSDVQELRKRGKPAEREALLERTVHSVWALQQVVVSRPDDKPEFAWWLKDLAEAVTTLQGLSRVHPGPGRMALLDGALTRLRKVHSAVKEIADSYLTGWMSGMGFHSDLPFERTGGSEFLSAIDVTKGIARLVRAELDSLMGAVELEPDFEPHAVDAGTASEIQVRVKNLSPLALRNLSVSTSPSVGSAQVGYFAEDETISFSAEVPACTEPGPFRFELRWQADRLDGKQVSGELPLAVGIRPRGEAFRGADLGPSPYIVGNPIDREEMFFGRGDIIEKIRRQLSTTDRANVVLLEGNRRTGKTSILKRLQASGELPGWIVVNCSLQGGEGHGSKAGLPTTEVFRLMARDIGWAAHDAGLQVWPPDLDPPDSRKPFKVAFAKALGEAFSGPRPFEVFELYIQAVLEAAAPRRLLLIIDEFDKLQEGIDAGITSPQVPENIRYLLHTYPGMSAVLAGSRRIKRLRDEYWSALFGFGHRVPVSELPLEDARLLVTRPVEGRLTYVPEGRERVVELCSRQPFLVQSLCNRIFERAALSNLRTVTVSAVNTAAREMVEDNEHFRTLWEYAATERRRFLLALCQRLEGEPDPIILSLLETKLEEYGIPIPRQDRLGEDLEFLRELELLELQETARGSAYKLAVPLMADWIRRNIDFEDQGRLAAREGEEAR